MTLPASLLNAIAAREGGRVALVVGAGCSFEPPTNLPLAWKCSEEAHRRLVADGILREGECDDPCDLSALADLVKSKNGGKQAELVHRLPTTAFKNASANDGHKITAALMVEGAISNVVTLNYDLALSHAVSDIGVNNEVSIVNGPEQHRELGRANVIYLHRSVDADSEDLVLTTESLESAWKDAWEELIARRAMASPVTVFAGLGSSCGVLRHSVDKLCKALGDDVQLFLADPGDPSKSKFAQEMDISDDNYVQLGWVAFMRGLGDRFHSETVAKVRQACETLSRREGWIDQDTGSPTENIDRLAQRIADMNLLSFGKARSAWLLEDRSYPKLEEAHLSSIADLLLAVAYVERCSNVSGRIQDDGQVVLAEDDKLGIRVLLVDGSAKRYRWLTLENHLRRRDEYSGLQVDAGMPKRVLACGVTGTRPEHATPPTSIVDDDQNDESIVVRGQPK